MKEAGRPYWKSVRCFGIGNVECTLFAQPARYRLVDTDLDTALGYRTKMRPPNHSIALSKPQHHIIDPTNPGCTLDDSIEHRLYVSGRPADDAEHFGGCSLMLQRLSQFCVAFLQFIEQPHILDRDDRLICKGLEQSDLFFRERSNLDSTNKNQPDRSPFA